MSRVATFSLALAIGLATLSLAFASSPETADGQGARLLLVTDYLVHGVDIDTGSLGVHTIRLNISLDGMGGKGSLGLDPNTTRFNAFGDEGGYTEIATRSLDVMLSAVEREDSTKKGRRLYEIKGTGLKGRLFLVLARERTDTHRLLLAGNDGIVRQVFPLRRVAKDQ